MNFGDGDSDEDETHSKDEKDIDEDDGGVGGNLSYTDPGEVFISALHKMSEKKCLDLCDSVEKYDDAKGKKVVIYFFVTTVLLT